jgi:hypothetical protein
MNNTVITSISALVFLVIGLFIGKSNKQIEIQTVVKTNIVEKPVDRIVEKPVVEYVDKYITNVVEKVVEADIPPKSKFALEILTRLENAKYLPYDKLPKGIDDLCISVYLDEKYDEKLNPKQILETLELEARKIGVKINKESKNRLGYEIDIMPVNDDSQFVYTVRFSFSNEAYLFATPQNTYKISPVFWSKGNFGILGKNHFNTSHFIENATKGMTVLCNRILETRQD